MSDIDDAGPRLKAMNDALTGFDQMRAEIDRLHAVNDRLRAETERWRAKAFNPVTLTDAEREAVERAADLIDNKTCGDSSTLRALLERTK